jgi:hypothetical protein
MNGSRLSLITRYELKSIQTISAWFMPYGLCQRKVSFVEGHLY